jgi:hypothetical protein
MFVSIAMVHQSGIEPASIAYQAIALPLSYRCVVGASCWVRSSGLGHVTAALCQTELKTHGAPSGTRTPECRHVKPMPWPLGEESKKWCGREKSNLRHGQV